MGRGQAEVSAIFQAKARAETVTDARGKMICKHGNEIKQLGPQCEMCLADNHLRIEQALETLRRMYGVKP